MKLVSFILLLCIALIYAGNSNGMPFSNVKKKCCNSMSHVPQKPQSERDCKGGLCTNVSCGSCFYLGTEPILIDPVIAAIKSESHLPASSGALTDYTNPNWNPPKV